MAIKLHTFTVSGRGPFPFNMLQFDMCHPHTAYDVEAILRNDQRTIQLTTCSGHAPTKVRWAALMWSVKDKS